MTRAAPTSPVSASIAGTKPVDRMTGLRRSPRSQAATIAPLPLGEVLLDQLPWGMGFLFINPGIFIMIGLSFLFIRKFGLEVFPGIMLALFTWIFTLFGLNLLVARRRQRALMLEAQLERAKKRAGGGRTRLATVTGSRSTNRAAGGIGARAAQVDFTKLDDQATAQMIERMEAMRGRIVQRPDEKTRVQVDAKWSALRKQLDAGDKTAAQKTWTELRTLLFQRK